MKMIDLTIEIGREDIRDEQDAIKYCFQGVIDNNRINRCSWADWTDGDHIVGTYLDLEFYEGDNKALIESLDFDRIEYAIDEYHTIMTQFYMHRESGDVQRGEGWYDDYLSTDKESWFGKCADECDPEDWIEGGHLMHVVEGDDDDKAVGCDWVAP